MKNYEKVKNLIEKFVGEVVTIDCNDFKTLNIFSKDVNVGYSQFNELLLLLGLDRITNSCFQFLVDQTVEYSEGSKIVSINQLEKGINEFRKLVIFLFANVKYGFKQLARDSDELKYHLKTLTPIPATKYESRHNPIMPIIPIPAESTSLLGYLMKTRLDEELSNDPDNPRLIKKEQLRNRIVEKGKKNQLAYLVSDHLDIYVATSMREDHEYISVNRTINTISQHELLKDMNLRWFDPTQAYCEDRIDKGLSEGLMLKRAKCTIYLAQESDTLGKDSELASTLAQGKPVIALVPNGDKEYVDDMISILKEVHPKLDKKILILGQLQVFDQTLAWGDKPVNQKIRNWINNPDLINESTLIDIFYRTVKRHYNNRAKMLKEIHPLGIQVDIETGIATGVLVVRSINDCAKLVKAIMLKELDFEMQTSKKESGEYTYLREKISNCIYRVVTGDPILTNTFWNFFIDEPVQDLEEL